MSYLDKLQRVLNSKELFYILLLGLLFQTSLRITGNNIKACQYYTFTCNQDVCAIPLPDNNPFNDKYVFLQANTTINIVPNSECFAFSYNPTIFIFAGVCLSGIAYFMAKMLQKG